MEKKLYWIMAALCLLAVIFSGIILAQERGRAKPTPTPDIFLTGVQSVCTVTKSNCEAVQESIYGKTFGIENAYLGIGGFLLMLALIVAYLASNKRLFRIPILSGALIGGCLSLRFLYLQAFVLKQYCIFCVIVDVLSTAVLVLGIIIAARIFSNGKKPDNKK
jgi:uncharacterized membrane protein